MQLRLIIEVDGPIHQYTQEEDRIRQEYLERLGYEVLRFPNLEVFNNIRAVLDVIDAAMLRRLGFPTATGGVDGGDAPP